MHCAGDGEPDRDFPALGAEKLLSDFNLDEYCICVVEGRRPRSATTSARAGAANTANTATDNSMSTFSPPLPSALPSNGGMRQSMSAGHLHSVTSFGLLSLAGGSTGRTRDDTGDTFGGGQTRKDRCRSSSKQSDDSFLNSVRSAKTCMLFWTNAHHQQHLIEFRTNSFCFSPSFYLVQSLF